MDEAFTLLSLVPFYLLGAFPTGMLVARMHHVDLTASGSGNVGATNVARVLGKRAGLTTLVIDILKGLLACLLAAAVFSNPMQRSLAAFAAVAGHCFSLPGKLRGGKGVATALGTFLYQSLGATLIAAAAFVLVFRWKRIVSLSSITAALVAPVGALLLDCPGYIVFGMAATALLVVARHRQNIIRLIEGREAAFRSAAL